MNFENEFKKESWEFLPPIQPIRLPLPDEDNGDEDRDAWKALNSAEVAGSFDSLIRTLRHDIKDCVHHDYRSLHRDVALFYSEDSQKTKYHGTLLKAIKKLGTNKRGKEYKFLLLEALAEGCVKKDEWKLDFRKAITKIIQHFGNEFYIEYLQELLNSKESGTASRKESKVNEVLILMLAFRDNFFNQSNQKSPKFPSDQYKKLKLNNAGFVRLLFVFDKLIESSSDRGEKKYIVIVQIIEILETIYKNGVYKPYFGEPLISSEESNDMITFFLKEEEEGLALVFIRKLCSDRLFAENVKKIKSVLQSTRQKVHDGPSTVTRTRINGKLVFGVGLPMELRPHRVWGEDEPSVSASIWELIREQETPPKKFDRRLLLPRASVSWLKPKLDSNTSNFEEKYEPIADSHAPQLKTIVEDLQSMRSEEKTLEIGEEKIRQLTNFASEILKIQRDQQEQINEIHKILGQQRPQFKKWLDNVRKNEKLNQYYEFISQHLMQAVIAAIAIGSNKLNVTAGTAGLVFKGLGKIANSIPIIGPAIALLTEPLEQMDKVKQIRNISNLARLFKNDVLTARWVISQFAIELTISKQDEICGRCTPPVGLKEKIDHYWKRLKTASKGKHFAIFTKENLNETTHLAIYDVAVVVDAVESNKIIREEEIFDLSQNEQELIMRLLSIFSPSDKREPRQLVDAKQLLGPSVEDLLAVVKSEGYKRTAKFDNFVRVKLGQIENSIRIQYCSKLNNQLDNIKIYFSAKLALFLLKCYAIAAGTMERAAAAVPTIKVINCEIPDVKLGKYRLIDLNHQRLLELMQLILNFTGIEEKLGPYVLIKESEKLFKGIVQIANETVRILISYYHQSFTKLSKEDLIMVVDVAICRILSYLHKNVIVGQNILVCLRQGCMSPNPGISTILNQVHDEADSKEHWKANELFEQIGICTPTSFYFHSNQPFYRYGYCEITDDEFNDFNAHSNNQYIEDRHKNYEKYIQSNPLLSPQNLESLDLIPFDNKEEKYNHNLRQQVNELSKQVEYLTKQNQTILSIMNQLMRIPLIHHYCMEVGGILPSTLPFFHEPSYSNLSNVPVQISIPTVISNTSATPVQTMADLQALRALSITVSSSSSSTSASSTQTNSSSTRSTGNSSNQLITGQKL